MSSRHVIITRSVLVLVPAFAVVACSSSMREEHSRSSTSGTSSQPLTPDAECQRHIGSVQPVYSATHFGSGNGTVDLGNGETATITNSDGMSADWSATIPIDVIIVRGSDTLASVHVSNPAAHSGARLVAPTDPDDQDRQLPLTSAKFCWLDRSGAAPVETPESSDPRACTHPFQYREDTWARPDAIIGRVETTDATMRGRFAPVNNFHTCTASWPSPTVVDATTAFHYDAWSFRNTTGSDACLSVSVLTEAQTARDFQVQVFRGPFDPDDPTAGYYAHVDNCRICELGVQAPAGATITVVLSAEDASGGGNGYRLSVGGCGGGGSGQTEGGDPDSGNGGTNDSGAGAGGSDAGGGGKAW